MEFFESFFSAIRDRLKKPFFGAFILSFIAYNWRVFYYLIFADGNVGDRIKYVDDNFLKDSDYLTNPFLIALCYMFFQSYLHLVIEKVVQFADIRRKSLLHDKRMVDLKNAVIRAGTEKEVQEARSSSLDLKKLNMTIENLNKENEVLQEKYNIEFNQRNTANESVNAINNEKDLLVKKLEEVKSAYDQAKLAMIDISKEKELLSESLEQLRADNEKLSREFGALSKPLPSKLENPVLWNQLIELHLSDAFIEAYRNINKLDNNVGQFDPMLFEKLAARGLIQTERPNSMRFVINPTDLGESLWKYYLINLV